jgi:putative ABC transport system substrate-binding protein
MLGIRRREFITFLGATAVRPLAARAQQLGMPVIGFLNGGGASSVSAGFHKGLAEMGYIEGRNVAIEMATTNQNDRLPALAAELVRRQVAVIYASAPANATLAAKAATATIPIVFTMAGDPVQLGLVASIARPGGNVTGVMNYGGTLVAKRLQYLRELVPQATTIGFVTNPTVLNSAANTSEVLAAGRSVGQEIIVFKASTRDEFDAAFAAAAQRRVGALLLDNVQVSSRREQLPALAARYRIPASYSNRFFVEAGGLMSYSDDREESSRQAGIYVGRILKGEKPADLPVMQPSKFQLIINLKTAKTLGIAVPPTLFALADELIE